MGLNDGEEHIKNGEGRSWASFLAALHVKKEVS